MTKQELIARLGKDTESIALIEAEKYKEAADKFAKYALWGLWQWSMELAGLPCGESEKQAICDAVIAARKARFAKK